MNGKIYAVVAICGALIVGAFAPSFLGPLRAQLNAPQTWGGTAGGSINALTLTIPNVSAMADLLGVPIRFLPANANAAGVTTVNINGIGAQAVMRTSGGTLVPIAGGDFGAGVLAEVIWDGTEFVHKNPATGSEPVGKEGMFTNSIPPGWLIENGTCVSQTTYSALYAYYGNSDPYSPGSTGGACPAGQFHLKFANGRASVAADSQGSVTANILTVCGPGAGFFCGSQNQTLAQSSLPNVVLVVPSGQGAHSHTLGKATVATAFGGDYLGLDFSVGLGESTSVSTLPAMSTTSINGGVTQTAVTTVQPTSTVFMAVKY